MHDATGAGGDSDTEWLAGVLPQLDQAWADLVTGLDAALQGFVFVQRFSATPRGARLARHLALVQLHAWGIPHGSGVADGVGLVIAELAANAVTHGRVPGRDFELRVVRLDGVVRVEVSDGRRDRLPCTREGGYGMRIIEGVAAGWGVSDRMVGKTVWAECPLRP
ncbi:ATP-binding protein [Streptomyces racemochromogenes]|uniref:ATP-binding protein n=1 Tax=Streptomyces racemochromogenes TaxID=67353 RepID=UPI0031E8ECEA